MPLGNSLYRITVFFDESRAQDLVPIDDRLKGLLDRRSTERALDFPTQGDVEHRAAGIEGLDEPAPLLRCRARENELTAGLGNRSGRVINAMSHSHAGPR